MISKFIKANLIAVLALGVLTFQVNKVEATTKVMWGKTELKHGQIGKVTILSNTPLVKQNSDGSLYTERTLKKGDEFRVYQYKGHHGGLYGVGASSFVQKSDAKVKYETPSKSKLEQVKVIKDNIKSTLTTSAEKNVEILGMEYGYDKVNYQSEFDIGTAILYSKQNTAILMTSTGDDLDARIQINYWNVENTSEVTKNTLKFVLGDKDGAWIYDLLNKGYKGQNIDKYLDKKLLVGKRQVELSNRPNHLVVYIGKENVKYDEKWNVIK